MQLNRLSAVRLLALLGVAILVSAIPDSIQAVNAETAITNYWVTVNPTNISSSMYTPVGTNWTVSFQTLWSYGDNSGQTIRNATVTIQVTKTSTDKVVNAFDVNTTTGQFSFNYSSASADILKFNATKLVTQDGTTYTPVLLIWANGFYGLQSEAVTVWWDTFHVSLVNYNTNTLGITTASVNVTYLLLPEEGLTLPEEATYSHQTFFPKVVHGANVTINGVKAEESEIAGTYTANSSIWLPTAYLNVKVSQEEWVTTTTGFSCTHNANQPIWEYAVVLGLAFAAVGLVLRLVVAKKSKSPIAFKHSNFPLFGGILLASASVISLYWGIVGLDSTLHGFEWAPLATLGLIAFCFGFAGAIMSMRKRNPSLAIFATIAPFITLVLVKTSLNAYQLATPWITLAPSIAIAILSLILITNSDGQFTKSDLNNSA